MAGASRTSARTTRPTGASDWRRSRSRARSWRALFARRLRPGPSPTLRSPSFRARRRSCSTRRGRRREGTAGAGGAGHHIALHGHRHRLQLRIPPRALADDLARGFDVVAAGSGSAPAAYRPPYGIFSPYGMRYARGRGWRPLLWSRWGRDWAARATPESIAAKVTEDLGAGDVLLLHDADWYSAEGSHRNTVAALPRVLDAIEARGLTAAGV